MSAENCIDCLLYTSLIVAAVILVCALGFNSVGGVSFAVAGVTINLSGLAVAAIAGILPVSYTHLDVYKRQSQRASAAFTM